MQSFRQRMEERRFVRLFLQALLNTAGVGYFDARMLNWLQWCDLATVAQQIQKFHQKPVDVVVDGQRDFYVVTTQRGCQLFTFWSYSKILFQSQLQHLLFTTLMMFLNRKCKMMQENEILFDTHWFGDFMRLARSFSGIKSNSRGCCNWRG